jgi:hypothetical protein
MKRRRVKKKREGEENGWEKRGNFFVKVMK